MIVSNVNIHYPIDLQNIEFYYSNYKHSPQYEADYQSRVRNYRDAKTFLNIIADDKNLQEDTFLSWLEFLVGGSHGPGLWHSGSMYRNKKKVVPHYRKFQELVQTVRAYAADNAEPQDMFDIAKSIVDQVPGAGVNYITEMMMTYNTTKYPNLNKNPLTVLETIGRVNVKMDYSNYDGVNYQIYRLIVCEIIKHLDLRDMLEVDSFFNNAYWKKAALPKKKKNRLT